jgi:hypothetical protein
VILTRICIKIQHELLRSNKSLMMFHYQSFLKSPRIFLLKLQLCWMFVPQAIKMTTQLSLPGMNTSHDLIFGAYRVCDMIHTETAQEQHTTIEISTESTTNNYNITDPDQQLQHLNKIVLWFFWTARSVS